MRVNSDIVTDEEFLTSGILNASEIVLVKKMKVTNG